MRVQNFIRVKLQWTMCAAVLCAGLVFLAGCASPGTPQPPSLHLPRPVSDLQAQRVGNSVQLRWTMPGDTTDKLVLDGQKKVTVCRRVGTGVCTQVQGFPEMPKAKIAVEDVLPPELLHAAPQLLTYEVQVMNTAGRSAGASNPAYAASGAAPAAMSGLHAEVTQRGVVLRWEQAGDEILVRREHLHAGNAAQPKKSANPLAPPSEPDVQMLRVHADAGGTLDASVVFGESYAYTAQRVRKLMLAGQSVEVRSELSDVVNVDVRDVFPPKPPEGLALAEPVRAADGSYAIDISWEANSELDLAGYVVYRRDMSALTPVMRVNTQLTPTPALHDAGLLAGHAYVYSVSAVDKSGNESKHIAVVEADIPQ
jgi:hypothetical protein